MGKVRADARYGRVLGVACTSTTAYFALVIDGAFVDEDPKRIDPPEVLAGGDRLCDFRDRMRREIGRVAPEIVVLTVSSYQASYEQISARAVLETLIRLAAAEQGVPSELVNQRTARARLGLATSDTFVTQAKRYLRSKVKGTPLYWSDGRAAAAATALARSMA